MREAMKDAKSPELLVVTPLKAHRSQSGKLCLTVKFISGVNQYVRYWPGIVTVLVEVSESPDTNLDHKEIDPLLCSFNIEISPSTRSELILRMRKAHIVLGGLQGIKGVNQVLIKEYGFRTRLQLVSINVPNIVRRLKRIVFASLSELRSRHQAKQALGIQCNGLPAYDNYKKLNSHVFLFFDNRIEERDLIQSSELKIRNAYLLSGHPLRLAFSGRLMKIKGADQLPAIAYELKKMGILFELNIFGDGECKEEMTDNIHKFSLDGTVHMHGAVRYRDELIPFLKKSVDLFVCTHIQGDPSCTYLETLACGIPIIGYSNEAWTGLVELSSSGWLTPVNNTKLLAANIAELNSNRNRIVEAGNAGREFAKQNLFEKTMQKRIEHIESCLKEK